MNQNQNFYIIFNKECFDYFIITQRTLILETEEKFGVSMYLSKSTDMALDMS